MKKVLALIMALAMVFALVACGPTEGNESTESTESIEEVIVVSSEENTTNTSSNAPVTNTSSQTQTPTVCSHKNVETTPAVAATCGAEGKTEGKKCKDCGAVIVASQTIPKDEQHYFTLATPDKPATCTVCGLTKGSVKKDPPPARVDQPTMTINGATITFSISEVKYTDNDTKCNIKYNVNVVNGPNAGSYSWKVDVTTADTHAKIAGDIAGSTPEIAANQTYNETFETGPVPLMGNFGYSLIFK